MSFVGQQMLHFLLYFSLHAQEEKKCAPLFIHLFIFLNQVLDSFDTGMNTPTISQSVHPSE